MAVGLTSPLFLFLAPGNSLAPFFAMHGLLKLSPHGQVHLQPKRPFHDPHVGHLYGAEARLEELHRLQH